MNDQEHVEFTTIKEDFNEYEVQNGQVLKFKVSLADILVKAKDDGSKESVLGLKDVSHVITDVKIDTSKMELGTSEGVTEEDQREELQFRLRKQVVCIYETKSHIIAIAPTILKIYSTNKKDNANNPILRFTYGVAMNTIDKGSLYNQANVSNVEKT